VNALTQYWAYCVSGALAYASQRAAKQPAATGVQGGQFCKARLKEKVLKAEGVVFTDEHEPLGAGVRLPREAKSTATRSSAGAK